MKKNYLKFMALLAIALPMAVLTSCGDDDDENETPKVEVKEHLTKMEGETYVTRHWLNYDERDNVEGVAIGTILYESEPTVAYVGVDDLQEAQIHFCITATPFFAPLKELKDGAIDAILNDSTGKEVNRIHFTVVNDGKVLAKAKLQNNVGIERYITEIRYISRDLWPENALSSNLPFRTGRMYKFKGNTYTCVSTPGYGRDGLLVRDKNNLCHVGALTAWGTEHDCACYPNANTMAQISKELNSTVSGPQLWQQLCATAGLTDLSELKKREYYTSTTHSDYILIYNLATTNQYDMQSIVVFWHESDRIKNRKWELEAYKFNTDNNGNVKMRIANNGIWMDVPENPYPNVSDWTRDEYMEKVAESIKLQ